MAIGEAQRPTTINHDFNANSNDHSMRQGSISLTRSNATTPYEPLCQARIEHDPLVEQMMESSLRDLSPPGREPATKCPKA